nr:hypothetical protein [Tanacetum cinerariifolium]
VDQERDCKENSNIFSQDIAFAITNCAKEEGCCLSSDTVIDCSEGRGMNPTPSRRTDSAPVYDTDGSAEVHENCDDNEIFNMFTQEEQYTELLKPILESHQVPQNNNDVIYEDTSVEQGGDTVDQERDCKDYFNIFSQDIAFAITSCFTLFEQGGPKEDLCMISFQPQGVSVWEGAEAVHLQAEEIKLEYSSRSLKLFSRILDFIRFVIIFSLFLLTKDLHTADYTQLYDFLKYNQKEVDELKAERLAKIQDPLALMANTNNPFASPALHQDLSSLNQNFLQQPITNPEDIIDPTTAMNMALALMAKAFKLNYSTPTNNNQRISSNPRNRQIAQPGMNMGQDRQMQMVGGNGGNQFRQYAGQNAGNLNGYNEVQNVGNQVAQNPRVQNVGTRNGLIGVQRNGIQNQIGNGNPAGYNDVIGNQNQIENGNLVAARAEGNADEQNGNQIRCYNCRGVGHYARNCTVRPRRRDAAYLQTQLLIAQKKEAGIQLQAEDYDLMAAAADLDEIKEVNVNCNLMANLQQASTSGTQTDSALVYDTDGSAE